MENLNAETVKRALECCSPSGKHCTECVYFYRAVDDICAPYLMADALALINSQEQRIKELTEENERLRADKDYWKSRAKESESEYNQAVKRGYNLGAIDYVGSLAERFIAKLRKDGRMNYYLRKTLDQIAKEILEDTK